MRFVKPRRWTKEELAAASVRASEEFVESRKAEGVEYYLMAFDGARERVVRLFEDSEDLALLEPRAQQLLQKGHLDVMRYLASPAISQDDLKTLTGLSSLSPRAMQRDRAPAKIVEAIAAAIDVRRFPWVATGDAPSQEERLAAEVATASLIATQDAQTRRRGSAKELQEGEVVAFLASKGLAEVPRREIATVADAPGPLEFCQECRVGAKKADVVIGLGDGRFMALECKASNSAVNSFKRLNHETVEKVSHWRLAFGERGVVGAAVLAGLYKVENLLDAQDEGVAIFWSFDLGCLGEFLDATML